MSNRLLVRLYAIRRLRGLVLRVARRLEGGEFRSTTLREIFARYWGVEVGLYTHGGCFQIGMVDAETKIGRYCSIAYGVRIVNHNHPLSFKGTSGLFFNPELGLCDRWLVERTPLEIGNDVWIGVNAVILPAVLRFDRPHAQEKCEALENALAVPRGGLADAIESLNAAIGLPRSESNSLHRHLRRAHPKAQTQTN